MSGFIVFIIIAIAWAFFGSIKAAADRMGSPDRSNPTSERMGRTTWPDTTADKTEHRSFTQTPEKLIEKPAPKRNTYVKIDESRMKREDMLPDFGDTIKVDNTAEMQNESYKPVKKRQPIDIASLMKGNRLVESIILAECLDRPRAHRPHPLAQQNNVQKRRG
jgi:hypothetical protein